MTDNVGAHILVSGRVRGVFFRENTQRKAKKLGINGWIKNLSGGKVEAVFEGDKKSVEKIVKWAKKGPILAKVENIDIEWQEYFGEFTAFEIRYEI
jgi:acylphosphatase